MNEEIETNQQYKCGSIKAFATWKLKAKAKAKNLNREDEIDIIITQIYK